MLFFWPCHSTNKLACRLVDAFGKGAARQLKGNETAETNDSWPLVQVSGGHGC
jgi:hypothetical protein